MAALDEIGQAVVLAHTKGAGICVTRLAKPHVVLRFSFPLDTRPCPGALETTLVGLVLTHCDCSSGETLLNA